MTRWPILLVVSLAACASGRGMPDGVLPGRELAGFGLAYDPARVPRQKSWIVDVGNRRLEMPISTVGG